MTLNRPLTVVLVIFSGIVSLHAQPAAVQQLQNNQISRELQVPVTGLVAGTNAPELYRGENEDVGPQRILRLNPRRTDFDVLFDSQFFFSDNANFAQEPASIASPVFVNTVQAAFAPSAVQFGSGKIAGAVGVARQWYNYGDNRLAPLDFSVGEFACSISA